MSADPSSEQQAGGPTGNDASGASGPRPDTVHGRALQSGPLHARENEFFCPRRGLNAGATARLDNETASLLQTRLRALSWLLVVGQFLALARFYFVLPAGIPGSALGLAAAAICVGLLRQPGQSRVRLRQIEIFLFAALIASLAVNQYFILGSALERGFLGLYRQMVNRIPGMYALALVAHGMVVPNRWRRAAAFAGFAVAVAVVTGGVVHYQYLPMAQRILTSEVIETASFGTLMLGLGAMLSIYGAHLIHGYRRNLAEMSDAGMYLLERRLGTGGMGEIWQAQHRMLRRPVAIKMIRPDLLARGRELDLDTMQRRFRREARATALLQSPNTVHLFDFGVTQDGTFFYVMEYLEGMDLATLVRDYGPMPSSRAVYLMRQAALSLREAHERGLVHRDVKPGNIHVGQSAGSWDWVKLLDFGLVKLTEDDDESTQLTGDHSTTGTPAFFPPEMVGGASAVDQRADIYALGAVTYWLVTGQLVFPDLAPLQMMLAHAKEEPIAPSKRAEVHIPPELEELIMRSLRKNPDDRPQKMDDFIAALDAVPLDDPWTPEKAADWWGLHQPEQVERAVSPGPQTGPRIV